MVDGISPLPPLRRDFFMITVERAKKILGAIANNLTDAEILKEIEQAEFFADLVFELYKKNKPVVNKSVIVKL